MASIDVDVDDFYDEMSSFEKREMAEMLERDGFITVDDVEECDNDFQIVNPNIMDMEWMDMMEKLFHSRLQISSEDEETIKKITNKL